MRRPTLRASTAPTFDAPVAAGDTSLARLACYALVWLAMATSGIVLFEPAPVDVLTSGLVLLLPMVGLARATPALQSYLCLWLLVTAAQLLAATLAPEAGRATFHTVVSLQLVLVSFVLAAFVADDPVRHARLLLNGWIVAGLIAATAAIAGYFDLFPGAAEMFTRHERASGTFKDPNVIGAFLVLPTLALLDAAWRRPPLQALAAMAGAAVLALAVLLTFSRGAWICLALGVAVWALLNLVTLPARQRRRLAAAATLGLVLIGALLAAALQVEEVARLIEMRASLSQSYDVGPDGRFGGQAKALDLIARNPLGLGSLTFAPLYHHEEAHNVYLSMTLNAGWLGGGLYAVIVILTVVVGFARLRTAGASRPYLVLAVAAFLPIALEGIIIDSDHWRHFYVQMALVWGLACSDLRSGSRPA